ncbi:hypothetical protein [Streptomyces canus]|uniref:hypothetical protein n=1 Tax=Streptomyces canus TaxID=58343 RepID=UPI0027844B6F|nr:hypothetical protein [Streptomyces canus]MDQ1065479.1 hypothetical protein [Streptomyces canus]
MKTWTERPAKTDVEAAMCHYLGLLRAGKILEAEQLVDHPPVRHVLKSLWDGSIAAGAASGGLAVDAWERDLSWLSELDVADFHWGDTGSHVYAELTYRAQMIEVALGFWVKATDAGWVVAGPSTLW